MLEARRFWAFSGITGRLLFNVAVGAQTIGLYRNWYYPFLDQFGILNDEYVLRLRNGMVFKVRPSIGDWHVVNEMWLSCPYFCLDHLVEDHSVVVDVGAHVGAFSLLAATLAKEVKVYSYEASPENYRILTENIELNGLTGKIIASQLAVCGSRDKRRLYLNPDSAQGHSLSATYLRSSKFVEVNCITLDDIFDGRGVERCGFLKLDCEGAEYEILLKSSDEYIKRVEKMSVEYHPVPPYDVNVLQERLESLGFDVTRIDRSRGMVLPARQIVYSARVLFARNRYVSESRSQ